MSTVQDGQSGKEIVNEGSLGGAGQLKSLLMDPHALDFCEEEDEDEEDEDADNNEDEDVDVDVESDTNDEAQGEEQKSRVFFRFNPAFNGGIFSNGDSSLYEITQLDEEDEDDALGASLISTGDSAQEKALETVDVDYISKIFEIYYNLYKSNYGKNLMNSNDGLPYGVVNKQEILESLELTDTTFEQISSELDYYLQLKISQPLQDPKLILRLQELNNVLNCLKTFQFHSFKEYLDSEFFQNLHEFVNKLDGQPDLDEVYDFIQDESKLGDTEFFYKLVIQFFLRGLFEQGIDLMNKWKTITNSKYIKNVPLFDTVVELVENYPYDNEEHIREWKDNVSQLANYLENNHDEETQCVWFKKLVYCLNGSRNDIQSVSTKWYETLSGLLHFCIPTIKLLPEYLSISLEQVKNTEDELTILEENLIYILENRTVNVLPYLESLHVPTSAFVVTLCESRGLLPIISDTKGSQHNNYSSYMLYQLALNLVTPSSSIDDTLLKRLYSLSFGILKISEYERYVRETVSELLLRYPIVTNEDMEYCMTVAAKWKLPTTISIIYQRLGMKLIYTSWLEAMIFFSKSMECSSNGVVSNTVGESKLIYYSLLLVEHSLIKNGFVDNEMINQVMGNPVQYNELPIPLRQSLSPYRVLHRIFELQNQLKMSEQDSSKVECEILTLANELLKFQYLQNYHKILILVKIVYPFLQNDQKMGGEIVQHDVLISLMENVNLIEQQKNAKDLLKTDKLIEIDSTVFLRKLNKQLNKLFCQSVFSS